MSYLAKGDIIIKNNEWLILDIADGNCLLIMLNTSKTCLRTYSQECLLYELDNGIAELKIKDTGDYDIISIQEFGASAVYNQRMRFMAEKIIAKDENIPFFEVMMDTQELGTSLVTGNIKHYPEGSCVTPQQLLSNLTYMENFVVPLKQIDYENVVEEKILQLISTGKYYLGNLLPKKFLKELKKQRLKPREHISINDYIK